MQCKGGDSYKIAKDFVPKKKMLISFNTMNMLEIRTKNTKFSTKSIPKYNHSDPDFF